MFQVAFFGNFLPLLAESYPPEAKKSNREKLPVGDPSH